ncbi:DUF4136 domain-containing protein [Zestomonas carbonaria]|uniref:DUF4136 domain-containing protein n=1 Tax=Zestomonas carbonaria TaxID=2762745 RepID=A0A7U7EP60_9GAMM|nr:DUF4136 domain-containing protein [Pseudomonas carbonaria]CAD5107645.1 hypothetical protein PSEWESI4_01918 [Pseudomonas carbonaria]
MKRSLVLLPLCLGLLACQSPNPYSADSAPMPPAPAHAADAIDLSAYPAAPLDFARYRTWSWLAPPNATGSLSAEQMQQILGSGFEQRGLRQAQPGKPADLQARANVRIEQRMYQAYDDVGVSYGYGHYPYWRDHYGLYGRVPIVRTYQREVLVLRIDLFDAGSGQPVWSGSGEAYADGREALRQATRNALDQFPPN